MSTLFIKPFQFISFMLILLVFRAEVEETSRLKFRTEPDPHSRRRSTSIPILASALESRQVYKHQTVRENHVRPIDRIAQLVKRELGDQEDLEDQKEIQEARFPFSIEPRRFYVLKN